MNITKLATNLYLNWRNNTDEKILSLLLVLLFSFSFINLPIEATAFENKTVAECNNKIIFEGGAGYLDNDNLNFEEEIILIDDIVVKVFYDYDDLIDFERPNVNASMEEVQEQLYLYRSSVQQQIVQNNTYYALILQEQLDLADVNISNIIPLVSFEMDIEDFSEEFLEDIYYYAENTLEVDAVYISDDNDNQTQSFDNLNSTLPKINVDSMVNSGQYTGSGLNIGFIESTLLDTTAYTGYSSAHNDYADKNISTKSFIGAGTNYDHIAMTTMIAVGNNGIAPNANILSASSYELIFSNVLDWMLENNANIINTSYGYHNGKYDSDARTADSFIKNYFITMVGAAGNYNATNNPNNLLGSPNTAYNYITVGNSEYSTLYATNTSSNIKDSSYGASKPNLIAPGKLQTHAYNGVDKSGTSFAAPQVTGCLALLMEEFPYLVAYPELCLSIVTASASPMDQSYNTTTTTSYYDASGLHNEIGSGLLNYEKMREAANNYISVSRPKNSATGMLDDCIEFDANQGERVRASLAWLANGTTNNNFTDYDLYLQRKLADGTYVTLKYINGAENNVEFLDYTFGSDGTYRLAIEQCDTNSKRDLLALSYVLLNGNVGGSTSGGITRHVCNNTIETGTSSEFHLHQCDCGGIVQEPHDRYIEDNKFKCAACDWERTLINDSILDTGYNYPEEYNFSPITATINSVGGHTVTTNRLRCGYISDNYLALSAKRNNAGTAYLEYHFDYAIYSITYDFGLWSDNESLIQNSSIRLEALDSSGDWHTIRTFDAHDMSTDKDNLLTYTDTIPFYSQAYRFIVETNQVQNENNRGRVVIGNISIVGFDPNEHIHEYNYVSLDNINHIQQCACGATIGTPSIHVLDGSYVDPNGDTRYTPCKVCGYMVDRFEDVIYPIIKSVNVLEIY